MKLLLSLLIFLICNLSFAQIDTIQPAIDKMARNTIYGDFFGNGFHYSLNYDRIISTKNRFLLSITVGAAYNAIGSDYYTLYGRNRSLRYSKHGVRLMPSSIVCASVNLLYDINRRKNARQEKHYLEIETGPILTRNIKLRTKDPYCPESRFGSGLFFHSNMNYRYQKYNGGLFLKVGLTYIKKIVEYKNEWFVNIYETAITPSICIGYTFKPKSNEK